MDMLLLVPLVKMSTDCYLLLGETDESEPDPLLAVNGNETKTVELLYLLHRIDENEMAIGLFIGHWQNGQDGA
jgi:hypothetical protein